MGEPVEFAAGCRMPSNGGIASQDVARRDAAKRGSDALRDRVLAYHRRHQPHLFQEPRRG
jgi:hypothetical protein